MTETHKDTGMDATHAVASPLNTIWVVIPAHNCASTVGAVAHGCRQHVKHVLVVDDGSTDADLTELLGGSGIRVIRHDANRGKGQALRTAIGMVAEAGGSHMIVVDADGQHLPTDLPKLISAVEADPQSIVIGCRDLSAPSVPETSRFGKAFSNFWVLVETGKALRDTQSGYRAYPIDLVRRLKLRTGRYDFEIEVLARGIWAGVPVQEVPVGVVYPPAGERVSSFRPFVDNLRISLLHMRLVGRRLVFWPHRRLLQRKGPRGASLLRHPRRFLSRLLRENATPGGLAASAAVGTILGVIPIVGFHSISIVYVTARLHLNKVFALAIQNLYVPPFAPFVCIEVGHYMRYGRWWTDFTWDGIVASIHHRVFEWALGSLIMAPFYAIVAAAATYWLAKRIQQRQPADTLPEEPA